MFYNTLEGGNMENIIVEVKTNVGDRKLKVNIFSKETIENSTIKVIKNMTLDEVRKYGKIKGWNVLVVND